MREYKKAVILLIVFACFLGAYYGYEKYQGGEAIEEVEKAKPAKLYELERGEINQVFIQKGDNEYNFYMNNKDLFYKNDEEQSVENGEVVRGIENALVNLYILKTIEENPSCKCIHTLGCFIMYCPLCYISS